MLRPVVIGPFVKGVIASTDSLTQPKGSVPRASNLLLSTRGALTTCDGTAIINAFDGVPQSNFGRLSSAFLFQPTGVAPYYLVLRTQPPASNEARLDPPQNLLLDDSGVGTLPAATYTYVVTALDGAGGETLASAPATVVVAANRAITLFWNTVPNAWGYNVYRAMNGPTLQLLYATGLPFPQPAPLTQTVTFLDTGAAVTDFTYQIAAWSRTSANGSTIFSYTTTMPNRVTVGQTIAVTGASGPVNISGTVNVPIYGNNTVQISVGGTLTPDLSGTGGVLTISPVTPPLVNTTRQTFLYRMPGGTTLPIFYDDSNIVARFPICPPTLGVPPSGGGEGQVGAAESTVNGGIAGMTSLIPQMVQFTNRVVIALGNGFSPQLYWDSVGTPTNSAPTGDITAITCDATGKVVVTTSATLNTTDPTAPGYITPGSNIIINGVTPSPTSPSPFNGTFVVTSVSTGSGNFTYQDLAAIGQSASSGGSWTVSTTPLVNTFVPAYPAWVATSFYSVNSIVIPSVPNGFYFKAVQGGESLGTEPTWPDTVGAQVADGGILWQNAGLTADSVPSPPGAAHVTVYAGSLWAWNTWPTNTATGLDGPTSLRMSDVDNPNSWNPVNQAFLDKDDGSEGMGLATFTISAEGIPPEGSLVAFKNYAGYQILGVFGSSNFAIQRIRSDMGCSSPRTIRFVPGFGICRYAHLGIANFDGVRDSIISEEVRPYLFASNSTLTADITPVDPYWIGISYSDLTASPAMYATAIPVGSGGSSSGALTRLLNYDLVLKAWTVIDLPFPISLIYQARSVVTTPLTILAGFSDGLLQRWQAGDVQWLTGGVSPEPPAPVAFSTQIADTSGKTPDQKMQFRRVTIRGISNGATSLFVTPTINGVQFSQQRYPVPPSGDFEVFSGVFKNGWRFGVVLSGNGGIEIDRVGYQLVDKQIGVPQVIS